MEFGRVGGLQPGDPRVLMLTGRYYRLDETVVPLQASKARSGVRTGPVPARYHVTRGIASGTGPVLGR